MTVNIDDLTIGQVKELTAMVSWEEQKREYGLAIVVVDRGFVYVGDVTVANQWCEIREAKNIRQWGTTQGLGELVLNGPLANTKLDQCGDLDIPLRAVISIHPCRESLWGK